MIKSVFINTFLTLICITVFENILYPGENLESNVAGNRIIAVNDTFYINTGCGYSSFGGSILENDIIPDNITIELQKVISPKTGVLSCGLNGKFAYMADVGFSGMVRFKYRVCNANNQKDYSEAEVFIHITSDFDCDGIIDLQDIDDDNDGIPDVFEGNGTLDADKDGIPDSFDIDSDNDGIPDNTEWQEEKGYLAPSGTDANKNGWDDLYEYRFISGRFKAVDSDNDHIPDFTDMDSDNDHIPDFIEASDLNADNLPDVRIQNSDKDRDGLDDIFDTVTDWQQAINCAGSNVPIPDHNHNGIRDFRERQTGKVDFSSVVFPNPSSGRFSLKLTPYASEGPARIRIYNSNGKMIYSRITTEHEIMIDFSGKEDGLYLLNVHTESSQLSERILIRN